MDRQPGQLQWKCETIAWKAASPMQLAGSPSAVTTQMWPSGATTDHR